MVRSKEINMIFTWLLLPADEASMGARRYILLDIVSSRKHGCSCEPCFAAPIIERESKWKKKKKKKGRLYRRFPDFIRARELCIAPYPASWP
jgi:hypothetical protein